MRMLDRAVILSRKNIGKPCQRHPYRLLRFYCATHVDSFSLDDDNHESVTYVHGLKRYLCARSGALSRFPLREQRWS